MKKKFLAIFLVIILCVTNMTVCYADGVNDLSNVELGDGVAGWGSSLTDPTGEPTWIDQADKTMSGITKTIMSIIMFILNLPVTLILVLCETVLPSMDTVIFNKGIWGKLLLLSFFEKGDDKMFANYMTDKVSTVYQTFRYLALMCFIIAIACIAVKMIISSIGRQKQQYKEMLKNWLIGLCLLVVGHWIMIYLIYISYYLVDLIHSLTSSLGSDYLVTSFINAINNTGSTSMLGSAFLLVLINLIVAIVFVAMNLKIFKIYLERLIVVAVLIMLFPLVTVLYVFEKSGFKRGATFNTWLSTYVSQVFIQPIHALSLSFVIILLDAGSKIMINPTMPLFGVPVFGPIIILMIINFVFKIEEIVKRVFAINGASMGQPMQPMRQVANLAKGATNAAITGATIGKRVASGGSNKLKRKGIFKDEMLGLAKGWGKSSGINVDRLLDMGLVESKNVDKKMSNALKNREIQQADIPEFSRRLIKNGDANELLANFGFKNMAAWEAAAKAPKDSVDNMRARMVLSESVNPGSAKKYVDDNGKIKPGLAGVFEAEQRGSDSVNSAVGKLAEMTPNNFRDIRTDKNMNALKTKLLGNPSKLQEIRDCGLVSADKSDDYIIENLEDSTIFSADKIAAIAYSETKGVALDKVVKKSDNGSVYVARTKLNPIGDKRRTQIIAEVVSDGFKNTFAEQQALASVSSNDKEYVNGVIEEVGGIDIDRANAWMNCDPSITLSDNEKVAMQKVFVQIKSDFDDEKSVYINDANTRTVATSAQETSAFVQAVPSGYTTTSSGIVVNKTVARGSGNNRVTTQAQIISSKPVEGTHMDIVVERYDNGKTSEFYEANAGTQIEDFASEIMQYSQNNGSVFGKFNDFHFSTSDYSSASEVVKAYDNSMAQNLTTSFINGESLRTEMEIDAVIGNLDNIEKGFVVNNFSLTSEEFATRMKTGRDSEKQELQEKLREILRSKY